MISITLFMFQLRQLKPMSLNALLETIPLLLSLLLPK